MQEEHVVEGSPSGQQEPAGRLTGSSQGAEEMIHSTWLVLPLLSVWDPSQRDDTVHSKDGSSSSTNFLVNTFIDKYVFMVILSPLSWQSRANQR